MICSGAQKQSINACGWCIIATAVLLTLVGAIMLGVGLNKVTNGCPCNAQSKACYFYSYSAEPKDKSCMDQAIAVYIIGLVLLVIGLIMACVSCCVCCGMCSSL